MAGADRAAGLARFRDHVDFILARSERLGLRIGLLPTWGDKWQASRGGKGPVIFNPENAFKYGEWLGQRYRERAVIWILGGDRNIEAAKRSPCAWQR
jgi:hypothetical protein